MFLWTRRIHYWQPHWKKWRKAKIFSLSVRKRKKKFKTFFRKKYLPNCSCKHVESSSGSPASIFLTKGQKCFTQCPVMIKNFDGFFCQPCWKIFDWMPKSTCSVCENSKNYLFFSQKNLFNMIPWTRRKQFSQTCRKVFARGPKVFRSFVETVRTSRIFSKKVVFFQGFRWTCGILFWQSCWNFFNKKLKKFAQKTKIIKKIQFFQRNSTKKFLGTHWKQFLQPNTFCSSSKMDRVKFLPSRNSPQFLST